MARRGNFNQTFVFLADFNIYFSSEVNICKKNNSKKLTYYIKKI